MRRICKLKVLGAVVAALFPGFYPATSVAQGDGNPPAVIACKFPKATVFVYLSAIADDGAVTYISPSGVVGKFRPDGILEQKAGQVESDCHGKSLMQLREAGQTREFSE